MCKSADVDYGPTDLVLAAPENEYTRALIDAAPDQHQAFSHFRPWAEVEVEAGVAQKYCCGAATPRRPPTLTENVDRAAAEGRRG